MTPYADNHYSVIMCLISLLHHQNHSILHFALSNLADRNNFGFIRGNFWSFWENLQKCSVQLFSLFYVDIMFLKKTSIFLNWLHDSLRKQVATCFLCARNMCYLLTFSIINITLRCPGEYTIQIDLLAVRKRYRKSGVGKYLIQVIIYLHYLFLNPSIFLPSCLKETLQSCWCVYVRVCVCACAIVYNTF